MTTTETTRTGDTATDTRQGMVAMCIAMALLPVGDAISKALTAHILPLEVTMWRTILQALLFVPVALLLRSKLRGTVFSWPALLAGMLVAVVMVSLVTAFQTMPIATAIAIFFIEPLLLTVLAGPLLGEIAGPRRYAAVMAGLVGAVIVIRPNFVVFGPVVLLPVLAAFAFALNMIVLRKATRTRSALTFQLGTTWCAAGFLLLAGLAATALGHNAFGIAKAPDWAPWAVVGAAALATLSFLLIAIAFSKAEASILAPFQYLEIVGATLVGFIVFGDFPDALTWTGTAIILGSGIYVFHRERQSETAG